jgi:hypothetical protein
MGNTGIFVMVSAFSLRMADHCLRHPLLFDALQAAQQKTDLQGLLAGFALQLADAAPSDQLVVLDRETHYRGLGRTPPPYRKLLSNPCQ